MLCLLADPRSEKALSIVEESAYTEAEKWAIDKYWDKVSRERTVISEADTKGRARGLAEGRAEEKLSNARNLKSLGVSFEIISQATGLSITEIQDL